MKIYLASSWRNSQQPEILDLLRACGHEVYDFRNPGPDSKGFAWSDIEPEWLNWDAAKFREALFHPVAVKGYSNDWNAMKAAEAGVILLPCGRSAHLEAGYFVGANKPLLILLCGKNEPELMYKMANKICVTITEAVATLTSWERRRDKGVLPDSLYLQ